MRYATFIIETEIKTRPNYYRTHPMRGSLFLSNVIQQEGTSALFINARKFKKKRELKGRGREEETSKIGEIIKIGNNQQKFEFQVKINQII